MTMPLTGRALWDIIAAEVVKLDGLRQAYKFKEKDMLGWFDELPAQNFGALPPLPDSYAVVWNPDDEMYYWTIRGTDIAGGQTWNRYRCRREAIAYEKRLVQGGGIEPPQHEGGSFTDS